MEDTWEAWYVSSDLLACDSSGFSGKAHFNVTNNRPAVYVLQQGFASVWRGVVAASTFLSNPSCMSAGKTVLFQAAMARAIML